MTGWDGAPPALRARVWVRLTGRRAREAAARALRAGGGAERLRGGPAGSLEALVPQSGLRVWRRAARAERARLRVVRRVGVPYLAWAALRRPGMWIGAAAYVAGMAVCAATVWAVRVEGAPGPLGQRVAAAAARVGAVPGAWRSSIRPSSLAGAVGRRVAAVTWVGADLDGGLLTLRVSPRRLAPSSQARALDLVAARAGTVVRVVPVQGTVLVKPGERVAQGQFLVAGSVTPGPLEKDGRLGPPRRVPAEAQVWVRFPVAETVRVPRRLPDRTEYGPWRVTVELSALGRALRFGPSVPRHAQRQIALGGPAVVAGRHLGTAIGVRWRRVYRRRRLLSAAQALAAARRRLAAVLLAHLGRSAQVVDLTQRRRVTPRLVELVAQGIAEADVAVPGGRGAATPKGGQ